MNDVERIRYMAILKDPCGLDIGTGNELDGHVGPRGEEQKDYLLGLIIVEILKEQGELDKQLAKLRKDLFKMKGELSKVKEPVKKKR